MDCLTGCWDCIEILSGSGDIICLVTQLPCQKQTVLSNFLDRASSTFVVSHMLATCNSPILNDSFRIPILWLKLRAIKVKNNNGKSIFKVFVLLFVKP